jgi:hypothetical protein
MEAWQTKQQQSLPRVAKKAHVLKVAREYYDHYDGNVFVAIGGIDSLTLLYMLRAEIDSNIKAVSVVSAEPKGNRKILMNLDNMVPLKPIKSKMKVLKEEGFPVGSKEIAKAIRVFQNPSPKNLISRRAYLTGVKGNLTYQSMIKLAKKWFKFIDKQWMKQFILSEIEYFKPLEITEFNYSNDKKNRSTSKNEILAGLQKLLTHVEKIETTIDVKVSEKCCYYTKEKVVMEYSKESGLMPYQGLMQSEGGIRGKALQTNACNRITGKNPRSVPFRILSKSDVLAFAIEYSVPVSEDYGRIIETGFDENGDIQYKTTKAQRTGCDICGFGLELEKRPHRFDRMEMDDAKEYMHWVNVGWGKIMDGMGIKYGNYIPDLKDFEQIKLLDV